MQELIKQLAGLALLQSQSTTPRPWKYETKGNTVQSYAIPGVCSGISPKTGNAVFIAAAGSFDYTALLAYVEQLLAAATPAPLADAALAELEKWLQNVGNEELAAAERFLEKHNEGPGAAAIQWLLSELPGLLARVRAAQAPKWVTPAPALTQPSNLPKQDEKVLLQLASGNYAVGQLTWAYRWLLQGGAVLLLQDVVRWQPIVGETVKGAQQDV